MENEQPTNITSQRTPVQNAALNYALSDEMLSSNIASTNDIIARAEARQASGIQAAEAGRIAGQTRIENDAFFRQEDMLRDAGANRLAMRESRGMATSVAQFQVFDETVNAQIRDINRVKQEALANNDALYYQQLSNLELETLQMRMQATQQSFQNILGLAGLGLQQQDFGLRLRGQEFQEEQAIGNIALEFGLEVQPGDTIDSIVSRAAPLASESRQLQLDQIRAQIAHTKAQSAELARAARDRNSLNNFLNGLSTEDKAELIARGELTMDMLAKAGDTQGLSLMANVYRNNTVSGLAEEAAEMTGTADERISALRSLYQGRGVSDADIIDAVTSIMPKTKEDRGQRTLVGDARRVSDYLSNNTINPALRYITGKPTIETSFNSFGYTVGQSLLPGVGGILGQRL